MNRPLLFNIQWLMLPFAPFFSWKYFWRTYHSQMEIYQFLCTALDYAWHFVKDASFTNGEKTILYAWHCIVHSKLNKIHFITRMHSSSMRTARLLTVSQHALQAGGVPASGGCSCQVGCTCRGRYLPRYSQLWTEWQTGAKILPWPKLRLRAVKIWRKNAMWNFAHDTSVPQVRGLFV